MAKEFQIGHCHLVEAILENGAMTYFTAKVSILLQIRIRGTDHLKMEKLMEKEYMYLKEKLLKIIPLIMSNMGMVRKERSINQNYFYIKVNLEWEKNLDMVQ